MAVGHVHVALLCIWVKGEYRASVQSVHTSPTNWTWGTVKCALAQYGLPHVGTPEGEDPILFYLFILCFCHKFCVIGHLIPGCFAFVCQLIVTNLISKGLRPLDFTFDCC